MRELEQKRKRADSTEGIEKRGKKNSNGGAL